MQVKLSHLLLMFIGIFCASFNLKAQEVEPDYEMEPYLFSVESSTIGDVLPIENAFVKAKAGATMYIVGVGNVNTYYYIKGNKSKLVLDKDKDKIIINTGGISPRQSLSVIKLQIVGSKRRWKTGTVNLVGASANEEDALSVKYEKYGENSVLIDLSNFEPGQYCIGITKLLDNSNSSKVYTFSIL